jgi:hypothetical protein
MRNTRGHPPDDACRIVRGAGKSEAGDATHCLKLPFGCH